MKTRHLLFSLVLVLALFLAACSPQAAPTEAMAEDKDMASEAMAEKDDMMADKEEDASDDEAMSDDKESMSEHDDDDMDDDMKEGEDEAMMGDKEDDMMSEKDDMSDEKDDDMAGHGDDDMMDDDEDKSMSDDKETMTDDAMIMVPDWFKASLVDVNTGETFTIGDYKGKVVLVETLAMWCSNCLKQQGQVKALHALVGERDDFISLGLDIDPNENADALKAYTANNGFDWVYAVAPTEVAREIGQLYGDQFLNPPSTPMLIIDRDGEAHLLPFGIKSAEDLLEALQPFLDAEM